MPFPTAAWSTGPLPPGVDGGLIDAAVLQAFGAPDAASRVQSIVVVQGGRIVHEQYHPLDGPDKQYNSFSVAKSFASALIGLLVADGMLSWMRRRGSTSGAVPAIPARRLRCATSCR